MSYAWHMQHHCMMHLRGRVPDDRQLLIAQTLGERIFTVSGFWSPGPDTKKLWPASETHRQLFCYDSGCFFMATSGSQSLGKQVTTNSSVSLIVHVHTMTMGKVLGGRKERVANFMHRL